MKFLIKNNTTLGTELIAGLTTFLTMSYIIFINPQVLSATGMNYGAVFVATCLVSAFGCVATGLASNYPIAIAPGMALNVYFTYVVVDKLGYSWEQALAAVLISGIVFFILTVTKIRRLIIEALPDNLNTAIAIGIGMFIVLLALKSIAIIKPTEIKLSINLANIKTLQTALFALGFCIIIFLDYLRVHGAILIGILAITVIAVVLGISSFHGVFAMPPSLSPTFLKINFSGLFTLKGLSVIFSFLLVALFDSTGTLVGLLRNSLFVRDKDYTTRISRILMIDSLATTIGATLGTSSASPFIESASGIRAGGRTGLTSVVVGGVFLCALFFVPLAKTIPSCAVAPALLYVGLLMIKQVTQLDWKHYSEYVPATITVFMIPFTGSIASGLGLGLISYILLKAICRKSHQLNLSIVVLGCVFVLYFLLVEFS